MKKLLRQRDIFLLTLAGIGDVVEEIRDPFCVVGNAYKNMYGFIPKRYLRHNFFLLAGRSFKTGYIEKIIKNGKKCVIGKAGDSIIDILSGKAIATKFI